MPVIPPILADGKLVSDFTLKTGLSVLQSKMQVHYQNLNIELRLNSFATNENDISLIVKNLNADKAHGWDNISIGMIQLCGKEIILPLQLLFKSMLEEGIFPDDEKKSNVVPVDKKESTNLVNIIQLVFFLSSVKSVKGLYSILCIIT